MSQFSSKKFLLKVLFYTINRTLFMLACIERSRNDLGGKWNMCEMDYYFIFFNASFLNCEGVIPVLFLKAVLKTDFELKPEAYITCSTLSLFL